MALHAVESILSRLKTGEIEEESDEELDVGDEADPDYELEESYCTEQEYNHPEASPNFFRVFRQLFISYCSSGRLLLSSTARITRENDWEGPQEAWNTVRRNHEKKVYGCERFPELL